MAHRWQSAEQLGRNTRQPRQGGVRLGLAALLALIALVVAAPSNSLAASGLRGEYFSDAALTGSPALTRTDPQVNFDWSGSPGSPIGVDNFSVRWTGQVEAPVSGSYTFSTISDDGVRLWLNGQQVINNWTDHAPTTDAAAAISLSAGQKVDLRMEFYERGGGAQARLLWAYPGQAQVAIPEARLSTPDSSASQTVTRVRFYPRSGWASRMVGGTIQGSNTSSSSGFVNLVTISAQPTENAWSELAVSTTTRYRYLRYVSPSGGYGNVAEVEFYSGSTKLSGTGFGTAGSWNNGGATFDKALDGNTTTFFDAPTGDGVYVGIDIGTGSGTPPTPTPLTPTSTPVSGAQRWSDPATWGGSVPGTGASVTIPVGKTVLLDTAVTLASLQIDGTLTCDTTRDLSITSGWIMIHGGGALTCGSAQTPYTRRLTVTLTATNTNEDVMGMGTRGVMLMGGRLELFGGVPAPAWTQLGDHAAASATQLVLKEATNWRAGDQLAIAPTDFYTAGSTERIGVSAASGSTVSLATGLVRPRWGKLQYVSSAGMTLTPDTSQTTLTLDERAEVGNLSRNIVIQSADDDLWRNSGFGAHVMAMEGSVVRLDGVELRRMGQAGRVGRYPVHFHGLSYRTDGTILADTSGQFVRNSSIWESRNRCIVIHATNGLSITNNICYDIVGHAIFLEDGIERRTTIERNLTLKVRNPLPTQQLLKHEGDVFSGGSSGFWITHPDNVLRNNVAADSQGNGIWYAFPRTPLGVFKAVRIPAPLYTAFGTFDTNVTHSNRVFGFQLDWVPTNDAGDISPDSYRPTANGQDPGNTAYEASLPYTLGRLTTYKNNGGSLWHREGGATLDRVVAADNSSTAFQGSANCIIQNSISIGNSLNNATPINTNDPPIGMASYHSSCDVKDHVFVNLPFATGKLSGVLNTSDYYIRPVDKGLFRDTNLRFINSNFGYRMPPVTAENWTLAGALWDPYGYAGPQGQYWVYDQPFFTNGTTCQTVAPAGQNGKSCVGPYYGLSGFVLENANAPWGALMPIEVRRDNGAVWSVGDGNTAPKLGNMRHAALVKGGTFTLRFPNSAMPRNVQFSMENMYRTDDWSVLAVQFDGTITNPKVYATTWHNPQEVRNWSNIGTHERVRLMTPAASITEVRNSTGNKYYQDRANNLVYVKLMHNLPLGYTPAPGSDDDLYRAVHFVAVAP